MKITSFRFRRLLSCLPCAIALGGALACQQAQPAPAAAAAPAADAAAKELAAMKADIQTLKDKAPSASVAMADVSFHWSNLWFAAEKKNWPLARYFFGEARQSMRWTILLRPVRQLPDGGVAAVLFLDACHITLRTVPERGMLLLDILALATRDSQKALDVFTRRLAPTKLRSETRMRG